MGLGLGLEVRHLAAALAELVLEPALTGAARLRAQPGHEALEQASTAIEAVAELAAEVAVVLVEDLEDRVAQVAEVPEDRDPLAVAEPPLEVEAEPPVLVEATPLAAHVLRVGLLRVGAELRGGQRPGERGGKNPGDRRRAIPAGLVAALEGRRLFGGVHRRGQVAGGSLFHRMRTDADRSGAAAGVDRPVPGELRQRGRQRAELGEEDGGEGAENREPRRPGGARGIAGNVPNHGRLTSASIIPADEQQGDRASLCMVRRARRTVTPRAGVGLTPRLAAHRDREPTQHSAEERIEDG